MTAALEAVDLSYSRPGGFRLEGFSLRLEEGELTALAGPNGAGKSTLLQLLAGLLVPAGGSVKVEGLPLAGLPLRERAKALAWIPQEMDAQAAMTVEEVVRLGAFPRSRWLGWREDSDPGLEGIYRALGLIPFLRRAVGSLSGGERRRTLLARGLAQGARLLLLDEPTAHLDPRHQAELLDLLHRLRAEKGVSILMALHDVGLALASCGRMVLMAGGRLLADRPAAEITPADLERAYGLPARIHPGVGGGPEGVRFSLH